MVLELHQEISWGEFCSWYSTLAEENPALAKSTSQTPAVAITAIDESVGIDGNEQLGADEETLCLRRAISCQEMIDPDGYFAAFVDVDESIDPHHSGYKSDVEESWRSAQPP